MGALEQIISDTNQPHAFKTHEVPVIRPGELSLGDGSDGASFAHKQVPHSRTAGYCRPCDPWRLVVKGGGGAP